jgi:hypothetical protein
MKAIMIFGLLIMAAWWALISVIGIWAAIDRPNERDECIIAALITAACAFLCGAVACALD